MSPTKIVRLLGLAIIVIVILVSVVLDLKGIVKIMESIANIVFIAIGALLTVSFGLLVFPKRFLGLSGKTKEDKKKNAINIQRVDHLPFYHSVNEAPDLLPTTKKDFWVIGTTSAYYVNQNVTL